MVSARLSTCGLALAVVACAAPDAPKKALGEIPDVTTSAEPEWLPFAIRAGRAAPTDEREKHLADLREITPEGDVARVAWRADGKALVVEVAGTSGLSAIDLGTGAVAAVSDGGMDTSPPLAPVGGVRVFRPGPAGNLVEAVNGFVSPDRARIAWLEQKRKEGELFVASVSTSAKEAHNPLAIGPLASRTPAFLPDSRHLAFACNVDDPDFQIYLVDLDAPRPEADLPHRIRVTFAEGGSEAPAFSPDGKHLAFVSRRHDHRASAPRHVFVARWLEDP